MRRGRIDENQRIIVDTLRTAGATVVLLSDVGKGVPDLLVGFRGVTLLMEVKDGKKPPSDRQLTPDQQRWHAEWRGGALAIVDSADSALRMIGVIK